MDEHSRWHAVATRDASADGAFVYAVKTTGIFCRPVCKARLARRANVLFFADAAAARAAGFRACKRCRPELNIAFAPEADRIARACDLVRDLAPDAPAPSLQSLATAAGLTKFHFHRLFKREMGMTPRAFVDAECERRRQSRFLAAPPTQYDLVQLDDMLDECSESTPADASSAEIYPSLPNTPEAWLDIQGNDLTVDYSVTSTAYGRKIEALRNGQLCWTDSDSDDAELMQRFEAVFPSAIYLHVPFGGGRSL